MFSVVENRKVVCDRSNLWTRYLAVTLSCACLIVSIVLFNERKSSSAGSFELSSVRRKDFLSASDARKDLDQYWTDLDEKTRLLNGAKSAHIRDESLTHHQQLMGKHQRNEPISSAADISTAGRSLRKFC
jgi:hypothetical protein